MARPTKMPPRRAKYPVEAIVEETSGGGGDAAGIETKPAAIDITDDRRAVALAPPKPKLIGRFRCESITSHQEKSLAGKKIVHVGKFVRTDKKHWFKITTSDGETIELSFADEDTFCVGREYTVAFFDPAVFAG